MEQGIGNAHCKTDITSSGKALYNAVHTTLRGWSEPLIIQMTQRAV